MSFLRRRRSPPPPTVYVGDHIDKLSRIRPIAHDEDDRPTREDLQRGRGLFDFPFAVPRWLRARSGRRPR
jgi:hypothetical protein